MKTITVTLYEKTATGMDPFHKTLWNETPVDVTGVLVAVCGFAAAAYGGPVVWASFWGSVLYVLSRA